MMSIIIGIICYAIGCASVLLAVKLRKAKQPKQKGGSRLASKNTAETPKTPGVMDIVLVFLGVFLLAFTVAMVVTYWVTGGIPDSLVAGVFGACTGECGFMAIIQQQKTKSSGGAAG